MSDLRTLLHEAAPTPTRPLDMTAVRRHSRQRRRRVITWLGGLGAVIGVAVPVGGLLAPAANENAQVILNTIRSTTTTTPSTPERDGRTVTTAAPDRDTTGTGTTKRSTSGATTTRRDPAAATTATSVMPASAGVPAPLAVETAGQPAYPTAASCSVDNTGLGGGEERRCRFTATTRGGASMRTTGPVNPPPGTKAEILVTRNGQTTSHDVASDKVRAGEVDVVYCSMFIEPGDLVEVVFTNAPVPDGQTTTVGAGESWACWEDH